MTMRHAMRMPWAMQSCAACCSMLLGMHADQRPPRLCLLLLQAWAACCRVSCNTWLVLWGHQQLHHRWLAMEQPHAAIIAASPIVSAAAAAQYGIRTQ